MISVDEIKVKKYTVTVSLITSPLVLGAMSRVIKFSPIAKSDVCCHKPCTPEV